MRSWSTAVLSRTSLHQPGEHADRHHNATIRLGSAYPVPGRECPYLGKRLNSLALQLRSTFHIRRIAQRPDPGEKTGLGSTREGVGFIQSVWDG